MASLGRSAIFYILLPLAGLGASRAALAQYQRASEGGDNVRSKLYPRDGKIELKANYGFILNQSYVDTTLWNFGFNYHTSKTWSFGIDYALASNSDRTERFCIENFYNDPQNELDEPCPTEGDQPEIETAAGDIKASYGPAYVPIREIQNILSFNMIWTPVYGKQLLLYNITSYFDIYVEFGGGLVSSLFFDQMNTLRNGNQSRGEFGEGGTQPTPPLGAGKDEFDSYGKAGRPDPISENHPMISLGIGQKFHFAEMFHLNANLRNITLFGTGSLENLFIIYGGGGVRF